MGVMKRLYAAGVRKLPGDEPAKPPPRPAEPPAAAPPAATGQPKRETKPIQKSLFE